jgi:hypothetical protein
MVSTMTIFMRRMNDHVRKDSGECQKKKIEGVLPSGSILDGMKEALP